jgi:hypothetical protein
MASHVIEMSCDHKLCDLLSHQAYISESHIILRSRDLQKYIENKRKIRKNL